MHQPPPQTSPTRSGATTWAAGALGVGVSAFCMWWMFRGLETRDIGQALSQVSAAHVVGYALVAAATQAARVWRWVVQVRGLGSTQTGWCASIGAMGLSAIFFLPARLGEFVRPVWLARGSRVSLPQAMSTIVAERLVDGAIVGGILLAGGLGARAAGALAPQALWRIEAVGLGAGVCFLGALGGIVAASRWRGAFMRGMGRVMRGRLPALRERVSDALERFSEGIQTLWRRKTLGRFLFWSAAIWVLNWAGVALVFDAVGVELPIHAAWIVLGATALGILVPAAPTSVGTFHFAVAWTLGLYGVPSAQALACALLMHAGQVASHMGLAGLGTLGWLRWRGAPRG